MPLRGCACLESGSSFALKNPNDTHWFYVFCSHMARLLNAMCPASNLPNLLQAPVSMPEASWKQFCVTTRFGNLWNWDSFKSMSWSTAFNSAHALGQLMAAKAVATSVFQWNKSDTPMVFQQRAQPVRTNQCWLSLYGYHGSFKNSVCVHVCRTPHSEFRIQNAYLLGMHLPATHSASLPCTTRIQCKQLKNRIGVTFSRPHLIWKTQSCICPCLAEHVFACKMTRKR